MTAERPPPQRFMAGADVVALAERTAQEFLNQADAHPNLSTDMAYDN